MQMEDTIKTLNTRHNQLEHGHWFKTVWTHTVAELLKMVKTLVVLFGIIALLNMADIGEEFDGIFLINRDLSFVFFVLFSLLYGIWDRLYKRLKRTALLKHSDASESLREVSELDGRSFKPTLWEAWVIDHKKAVAKIVRGLLLTMDKGFAIALIITGASVFYVNFSWLYDYAESPVLFWLLFFLVMNVFRFVLNQLLRRLMSGLHAKDVRPSSSEPDTLKGRVKENPGLIRRFGHALKGFVYKTAYYLAYTALMGLRALAWIFMLVGLLNTFINDADWFFIHERYTIFFWILFILLFNFVRILVNWGLRKLSSKKPVFNKGIPKPPVQAKKESKADTPEATSDKLNVEYLEEWSSKNGYRAKSDRKPDLSSKSAPRGHRLSNNNQRRSHNRAGLIFAYLIISIAVGLITMGAIVFIQDLLGILNFIYIPRMGTFYPFGMIVAGNILYILGKALVALAHGDKQAAAAALRDFYSTDNNDHMRLQREQMQRDQEHHMREQEQQIQRDNDFMHHNM